MVHRKVGQHALTLGREAKRDLAAIGAIAQPFYQTVRRRAVHQFDGAVVANLQALGNIADGRLVAFWQAAD